MNIALLVTLALFYFPTTDTIPLSFSPSNQYSYWWHYNRSSSSIIDCIGCWKNCNPLLLTYQHTIHIGEQNRKDLCSQTFLPSTLFVLTVLSWSPSQSHSHHPHPHPSRSATLAGSPVKSWSDSICARIPPHSRAERGRRGIFKFKLSNKFGKL